MKTIEDTLAEIDKQMDCIENCVDTLHSGQIGLIRWIIGVGLTQVALIVTLLRLL